MTVLIMDFDSQPLVGNLRNPLESVAPEALRAEHFGHIPLRETSAWTTTKPGGKSQVRLSDRLTSEIDPQLSQ